MKVMLDSFRTKSHINDNDFEVNKLEMAMYGIENGDGMHSMETNGKQNNLIGGIESECI